MIRTRYWRLKLILVPLNGFAGFMAASELLSPIVRLVCGAIAAACTPLYALINEVPRSKEETEAGS